ncbi:MAG: hypothetical protein C0593_03575 [Marinilabiliales bacterium]|nr:MAG: hypothetical protein C0593_03575 [Marinilabiliales bacterium]
MKYSLLTILLFLCVAVTAQQIPRQKVILEVGTATWCSACPAIVNVVNRHINDEAQIAVIEYHLDDDYANSASVIRDEYYAFQWFPCTYYDGEHFGYDNWATYSFHKEKYEEKLATPSSFRLDITGDINETSIWGSIIVQKVAEYIEGDLTIHIVLTEENIEEEWMNQTELDFVERTMFPDGHGTAITFSGQPTLEIPFEMSFDPGWDQQNCKIVFFLQDNTTKEILQGEQIDLLDLPLQTGISNSSVISDIEIFPNPFTESIKISGEGVEEIVITDVTGKVVFSPVATRQNINASEWTPGIYFVTTIKKGQRKTSMVLKK